MEEMNISEIFAEKCEENQTRKILEIMRLTSKQKVKKPRPRARPHGQGAHIEGEPFNEIIIAHVFHKVNT